MNIKNPVILIVLYRRYYELCKNLPLIRMQCAKEIGTEPVVVVVWSDPNVGHLWIFQELINKGMIQHFLTRKLDTKVKQNNSYNCSRDLRVGMDFIKENYPNSYIIAHTPDCVARDGIYKTIDSVLSTSIRDAFLVTLPNSIIRSDIWHTNFFAVSLNESYWPPITEINDPDLLERKWGRQLRDGNFLNFEFSHNNKNKIFSHVHESETVGEYLMYPQNKDLGVTLYIKGNLSLKRRLYKWLRSLLNLIPRKKPVR